MPNKAIVYLILIAIGIILTFRHPFNGILTFIVINYLRPEIFSYGVLVKFNLYIVVASCIVVSTIIHGKINLSKITQSPTILFLLIMLVPLFISCQLSLYPHIAIFWWKELLKIFFFCCFMIMLTDTEKKMYQVVLTNILAGGFLAIWAFQQHFRGNLRLEEIGGGATNTSNGLAALFVLLLPFCIHYISSKKKLIQLSAIFLSSFLLSDIVFTQSRSAFAAFFIAGGYFFLRYKSRKKYLILVITGTSFLFAASVTFLGETSYLQRMQEFTSKGLDTDHSTKSRGLLAVAAIDVYKSNKLLGIGLQNFKYRVSEFSQMEGVKDAHNTFLLILAEGGMLAFIPFVLVHILFFWKLRSFRNKYKDKVEHRSFCNFITATETALLGFLICSLAHSYTIVEYYYWFLVLPEIIKFNLPQSPLMQESLA